MSKPNLKQANRKWKHEQKRRKKQYQEKQKRVDGKIRHRRAIKLYNQGRDEYMARKAREKDYVDNLTAEVENESRTTE